jgi:hypothetical protein
MQLAHFIGPEQAMIDGDKHLLAGDRGVLGLQNERRCQERPVNARGAIMRGGAPHAVIDPRRRSNVTPRNSGAATGLSKSDLVRSHSINPQQCY